ncbi:hypothetical protein C8R43DRAFT_1237014 [Mycena crocata]|nr:hypothetical protein C8R43DRAFT_1237014 [Mycena crocata]
MLEISTILIHVSPIFATASSLFSLPLTTTESVLTYTRNTLATPGGREPMTGHRQPSCFPFCDLSTRPSGDKHSPPDNPETVTSSSALSTSSGDPQLTNTDPSSQSPSSSATSSSFNLPTSPPATDGSPLTTDGSPLTTDADPSSQILAPPTSTQDVTTASQTPGSYSSPSRSPATPLKRETVAEGTTRRQHLEDEMRAARERLANLEAVEQRAVSTVESARSDATSSDWEAQLQAARQQIQLQAALIHELESHMDSEWVLGLSDEAPPGYVQE